MTADEIFFTAWLGIVAALFIALIIEDNPWRDRK